MASRTAGHRDWEKSRLDERAERLKGCSNEAIPAGRRTTGQSPQTSRQAWTKHATGRYADCGHRAATLSQCVVVNQDTDLFAVPGLSVVNWAS